MNRNSEKLISKAGSPENILEICEKADLLRCVTSLPFISILKTERMFIYRPIFCA